MKKYRVLVTLDAKADLKSIWAIFKAEKRIHRL